MKKFKFLSVPFIALLMLSWFDASAQYKPYSQALTIVKSATETPSDVTITRASSTSQNNDQAVARVRATVAQQLLQQMSATGTLNDQTFNAVNSTFAAYTGNRRDMVNNAIAYFRNLLTN